MSRKGVRIGHLHTYDDWRLWLVSTELTLPEAQTKTVQVPGRDGLLDLSTALDGMVHYDNRTLTVRLGTFRQLSKLEWSEILASVAGHIHGQTHKLYLDEDPYHYLIGRGNVTEFEFDYLGKQAFEIEFACQPWRYKANETTVKKSLTTTAASITLENDRMPVVPEITVSKETTLTWGSNTYKVSAGTHKILDIMLVQGTNTIKAKTTSGTGTITITYQEGSL